MVASCPSPRCSCRKRLCYEEKQRVWSRSCGLQDLYNTVIVLSVVLWDCCKKWTIVEIEILATVKWTCGCQPFSCRCSQNVTHCRKEMCWTCLFKESMPFVKSKPPLPTRSLSFLRAAVRSSICASNGGIMPISSLQLQKNTSLRQRSRGSSHGVVVSKICYNTVIVLSVVLCDCCQPMNHCWDWAFSKSELDVWLPAFELPMFPKCDALPKGDLLDMFV